MVFPPCASCKILVESFNKVSEFFFKDLEPIKKLYGTKSLFFLIGNQKN